LITLTKDQNKAIGTLLDWYKNPSSKNFITLGGYAGTGKTSLIGNFRLLLNKTNKNLKVAFCSYTGKATRVLRVMLLDQKTIFKNDSISTIHSLIYSPMVNSNEEIIGWEKKEKINFDLIILDEASMVDESIWDDLLSYGIPIIAVGDHGQLPPVNGKFNLMANPELKLEEIHRQKKGNSIIDLSIMARTEGFIPEGTYGKNIIKISRHDSDNSELINEILSNYSPELLILCGYNTTRIRLNNYIRHSLEFTGLTPQKGDRVICLRNNHEKNIFNGMLGSINYIDESDDKAYYAKIDFDDEPDIYKGFILAEQFGNKEPLNFTQRRNLTLKADLFDFGYALTVHKAQGSQARKVLLFEERFPKMDDEAWRRWLYTAVTRASEELIIVGN